MLLKTQAPNRNPKPKTEYNKPTTSEEKNAYGN
jgi:hypothetical protein